MKNQGAFAIFPIKLDRNTQKRRFIAKKCLFWPIWAFHGKAIVNLICPGCGPHFHGKTIVNLICPGCGGPYWPIIQLLQKPHKLGSKIECQVHLPALKKATRVLKPIFIAKSAILLGILVGFSIEKPIENP